MWVACVLLPMIPTPVCTSPLTRGEQPPLAQCPAKVPAAGFPVFSAMLKPAPGVKPLVVLDVVTWMENVTDPPTVPVAGDAVMVTVGCVPPKPWQPVHAGVDGLAADPSSKYMPVLLASAARARTSTTKPRSARAASATDFFMVSDSSFLERT